MIAHVHFNVCSTRLPRLIREFSQPVSSLFDEEARPRNGPTQWVSAPQLSSTRQAAPRTRPSLPSQPLRISSSCSIPSYDTLHIIFLALCREGSPALARRVGMPRKVRRSKASTHHHSKSDGDEKLEFAGWENPLLIASFTEIPRVACMIPL